MPLPFAAASSKKTLPRNVQPADPSGDLWRSGSAAPRTPNVTFRLMWLASFVWTIDYISKEHFFLPTPPHPQTTALFNHSQRSRIDSEGLFSNTVRINEFITPTAPASFMQVVVESTSSSPWPFHTPRRSRPLFSHLHPVKVLDNTQEQ